MKETMITALPNGMSNRFRYAKRGEGNHCTWGVYECTASGNPELVCVCVYKKGAVAVCNRLNGLWKGDGQ